MGSSQEMMRILWVLGLWGRLLAITNDHCAPEMLLMSGSQMSTNMCHLYNDSHLDKLNAFVFAENATITLQDYDFGTRTCGDFYSLPLNEYFPRAFQVEHSCSAAIPVWSEIGADGMVSVTGYGELVVATQSKIREITFIYNQPFHDCTLKLDSMVMVDVQCLGMVMPSTSSSADPLPTTSTWSTTTPTRSISSGPFYDQDKYTSIVGGGGDEGNDFIGINEMADSFNNPLLHSTLQVCRVRHPRYKVIMTEVGYRHAALVCLRKGLRLAGLPRTELGDAIDLVRSCLGAEQAVWIRQYWNRESRTGQCLELATGRQPMQGTINMASSCNKRQAVLCEEAFLQP